MANCCGATEAKRVMLLNHENEKSMIKDKRVGKFNEAPNYDGRYSLQYQKRPSTTSPKKRKSVTPKRETW